MQQEVMVSEILRYVQIWGGAGLLSCVIFIFYYRRFTGRHPEIFRQNGDFELKRKNHNLMMSFLAGMFIWVAGLLAIAWYFTDRCDVWFFMPVAFGIWFPLSCIQKKSTSGNRNIK